MKEKTPIVSIILPTYNGRKEWFEESVNSVLNQTFSDFELIIINDCSTNNIENTIREYEKKDSRIVYVKNEKNLKLTKTLNKGLSIAKGKYIARIDDDDIWSDRAKLEMQVDYLEKHKDYGLVGTNCLIVNEYGETLYKLNRPRTDKEIRENLIVGNWIVHSSIVMRKSYLVKVGGEYDTKWKYTEDYELWLRLLLVCKGYNFVDSYIKYRVNEKSVTISHYREQKRFTLKLIRKYYRYYPKKYLLKAILFHLGEFIVPEKLTKFVLKKIRCFKI